MGVFEKMAKCALGWVGKLKIAAKVWNKNKERSFIAILCSGERAYNYSLEGAALMSL